MKKILKFMNIVLFITIIVATLSDVYAALGEGLDENVLDGVTKNDTTVVGKLDTQINKVFGTIMNICKILGVAGIVVNGVRYMYASSNDKAKIKQSLIFVVIGTVFIFAADIVVKIITGSWGDISNDLI